MPALALTDSANLFGMVKFYRAARAAGLKPVLGADCWLQNDADRDKPFRAAAAVRLARRLPAPVRACCRARGSSNQHRARAEIARELAARTAAPKG